MKKIVLSLIVLLISGLTFAQQNSLEQDRVDESKFIQHVLVDTADGYTGKTGLTPTCRIVAPGLTTSATCSNSATEVDSTNQPGVYRVALSAAEMETPGDGMMILTGTGSIPSRVPFTVKPSKLYTNNNLIRFSNSLGGSGWTAVGATTTSNSSADWNGDSIADTLTANGANSQHLVHTVSAIPRRGGSGLYVITAEVKSGTANNAWVGDGSWGAGVDVNTSTGAVSPTAIIFLRGWHVEAIGSGWYKVSVMYQIPQTETSQTRLTLGIGNGTPGTAPPSFTSSGTMLFARATISRAEEVPKSLLDRIAPNLQSAANAFTLTLAASESPSDANYANREICVWHQGAANTPPDTYTGCSCIQTYTGSTRVAVLFRSLWTVPTSAHKYRIGGYCPVQTSIPDNGITSATFGSGAITAGAIATDAITAAKIAADAIGASEIANNAIDVDAIAANAITSNKIADNTITAAKIANDAITAAGIAADAIGASEIAANAIGSSEIAADAIGASQIAADAIGASEFTQAAADEVWLSATRTITGGTITTNSDKVGYNLADGALTAVKFSTDARNAFADAFYRRNMCNVESSSYGDTLNFNSGYGATQQQTGRISVVDNEFKVYRCNNTDVLSTRTTTGSSAAKPITGINP